MNDEQILNALKSCGDGIAICDDCPYEGRNHCSLLAKQDIIARFEGLKAENESLVREADEKAALAMQHKMRADDLEKKNAELKARLEKAVELPQSSRFKFTCISNAKHQKPPKRNVRSWRMVSYEETDKT